MKKFLLFIAVFMLGLTLVACNNEPEEETEDMAPTIAGIENTSVKIGESFDAYDGVTATDEEDGNLTSSVSVRGTVDTSAQGSYTITYVVVDSAGNVTEEERVVAVTVGEAPVLQGLADATISFGSEFDPLAGVTATDVEDGVLTESITFTGSVDNEAVGTYDLTYSITDSAGNVITETITITVEYGEKTIVTYAGWNVGTAEQNNIIRRSIAAFNEQSPIIEIQIVEYEGNYNEFLATKAAAGEFPDVVLSGNVPDFIVAGYAADITMVAEADEEWTDIPQSLRDAITYDGRIFAVPSAQNYLGMFANLDLIDDSGITTDFTALNYSYAEWIAAVEAATDTTHTDGTSTAGLTHPGNMINWLPAVLDAESAEPLGITHFALAGNEFLLNSQPVKDALAEAANLVANGWSVSAYSTAARGTEENPEPSIRQELFGDNWDGRAFRNGQTAFNWDGTWGSGSLADQADGVFDIQFVGLPGANVVGVSDFMTISKTTENLEAAFEVAKWLTFGEDGINAKFDIVENVVPDTANGEATLSISGLPINEKQEIIDMWFANYPMPGVQEFFEGVKAGDVTVLNEGNKFVPGFLWARYWYDTGIEGATTSRPDWEAGRTLSIGDLLWDAQSGLIDYSQYMTQQLQDSINYEFIKAKQALDEAMNE